MRKDTTVSVGVSRKEKERWQQYAKELDLSVSSLVKKAMTVYLMLIDKRRQEQARNNS